MKRIMPKWSWEVCKMFMYMTFPVAMFHYFNSPQIYEEELNNLKKETFPRISSVEREYVENIIREINAKHELKRMEKLKANQDLTTHT